MRKQIHTITKLINIASHGVTMHIQISSPSIERLTSDVSQIHGVQNHQYHKWWFGSIAFQLANSGLWLVLKCHINQQTMVWAFPLSSGATWIWRQESTAAGKWNLSTGIFAKHGLCLQPSLDSLKALLHPLCYKRKLKGNRIEKGWFYLKKKKTEKAMCKLWREEEAEMCVCLRLPSSVLWCMFELALIRILFSLQLKFFSNL